MREHPRRSFVANLAPIGRHCGNTSPTISKSVHVPVQSEYASNVDRTRSAPFDLYSTSDERRCEDSFFQEEKEKRFRLRLIQMSGEGRQRLVFHFHAGVGQEANLICNVHAEPSTNAIAQLGTFSGHHRALTPFVSLRRFCGIEMIELLYRARTGYWNHRVSPPNVVSFFSFLGSLELIYFVPCIVLFDSL